MIDLTKYLEANERQYEGNQREKDYDLILCHQQEGYKNMTMNMSMRLLYLSTTIISALHLFPALAFAEPVATPQEMKTPLQTKSTPVPSSTLPPTNKCDNLPLLKSEDKGLEEVYTILNKFEKAFEAKDVEGFRRLIHPAMQQKKGTKDEAFLSVYNNYGLVNPKLLRTAVFELKLPDQNKPEANCSLGVARGVVGPKQQFAVIHTYFSGNEQIRFYSLFAPIPATQAQFHKSDEKFGLVLFQVQVWSHDKKTPERLLETARAISSLNEPLSAWILAEGARRIAGANPYFEPTELQSARSMVEEFNGRRMSSEQIRAKLIHEKLEWSFVDFTTIYQSTGIEVGIIFRMNQPTDIELAMRLCKKNTRTVAKLFPELRRHFRGIECLAYQPKEDTTLDPALGSVFLDWKELSEPK